METGARTPDGHQRRILIATLVRHADVVVTFEIVRVSNR